MSTIKKIKPSIKIIVFIIVCLFLISSNKNLSNFYGFHIYPFFSYLLSHCSDLFPFSIFEWIFYIFIIFFILFIVQLIYDIFKKDKKKYIQKCYCIFYVSSILWITFMLLCGINYHRDSFATCIQLQDVPSSKQNLILITEKILKEIQSIDINDFDIQHVQDHCREAMTQLSLTYPSLKGFYPRVKPVFFSKGLSYLYISGIFTPWTVEANYNQDMLLEEVPFTLCHELSHLRGFMQEEEANFIAYLACHHSSHALIKYSGELEALSYCLNALLQSGDVEMYQAIYQQLPDHAKQDLQDQALYWQKFNTSLKDIHEQINDTYLKLNQQTLGTQSYQYFVELLIDYYGGTS